MIRKGDAPGFYQTLHQMYGSLIRAGARTAVLFDPNAVSVIYGVRSKSLKIILYPSHVVPLKSILPRLLRSDHSSSEYSGATIPSMFSPVDLHTWLQWYGCDVIGAITFQERFGFMEERKDVRGMIGAIFTQECIDHYNPRLEAEHSERPDFLSWLRGEEAKGKHLSNRYMIIHLRNNLFAGSGTTGISLRAIIYFLNQTLPVYPTLHQEIDAADRLDSLSEYVTYEECFRLEYLSALTKKTMRCHPGVCFHIERIVLPGGATLNGTRLQTGMIFGETLKQIDWHIITFGYGSRTCIGQSISIMAMGKLIPQILRHFGIEWAADKPTQRV
ncbi:cytochrome P450 [Aspergillus floccosus]